MLKSTLSLAHLEHGVCKTSLPIAQRQNPAFAEQLVTTTEKLDEWIEFVENDIVRASTDISERHESRAVMLLVEIGRALCILHESKLLGSGESVKLAVAKLKKHLGHTVQQFGHESIELNEEDVYTNTAHDMMYDEESKDTRDPVSSALTSAVNRLTCLIPALNAAGISTIPAKIADDKPHDDIVTQVNRTEDPREVKFNDALAFVDQVKRQRLDVYEEFLVTLQDYQRNTSDISEVQRRTTEIFKGSPHLIEGLKAFFPPSSSKDNQGKLLSDGRPNHDAGIAPTSHVSAFVTMEQIAETPHICGPNSLQIPTRVKNSKL